MDYEYERRRNEKAGGRGKKITDEMADEIMRRFVDEGDSVKSLAREYGVHESTIYRALYRPERAKAMNDLRQAQKAAALLRVSRLSAKAVDRMEEYLDKEFDDNHKYIQQQVAVDVLNRAGVREEKTEEQKVSITFADGGFETGQPPL